MNRTVHKFCAWSGIPMIVLMGIGFVLLAGFIPAPSPGQSVGETAQLIIGDRSSIRWGMIIMLAGVPLLMPLFTEIAIQMARIEGRYPALAMLEFSLGALLLLLFIFPVMFWQIAAYRVDRQPELIQLLNDMAWIPFLAATSTVVLQLTCYGIAILLDKRERPIFPRWLGYFQIWVAMMFTPATFVVFFLDGPLAWNGIFAFYLPLGVFGAWLIVNSIYLSKAVDTMNGDESVPADIRVIASR